jgi:release factor glutamine methyltransferase
MPFALSPETLVPRPDTETVVELALEMLRERPANKPLSIADLGTGTGAILLALLSELPDATGIGTDISVEALETATANAVLLGLATRANFIRCDYASALSGPFDLIVSNPPYIRTSDIAGLAVEVRDHDPQKALDGGPDGLDAYRALIPQAASILAPGASLVVETGQGQAARIEALMTAAGLVPQRPPRADLAGIPRAVGARKMPL